MKNFIVCKFLVLVACIFFYGCITDKPEIKFKKEEFNNSIIYHIVKDDSTILDICFLPSGELSYVSNFPKGYEQLVSYYNNSGAIQSKLKMDTLGRIFGRAYYFHDKSGNLSSDYNYIDDIKVGSAVSYHDSTERVKAIMLYNEKGELFYKKSFDKYGNHIKTEGSKD